MTEEVNDFDLAFAEAIGKKTTDVGAEDAPEQEVDTDAETNEPEQQGDTTADAEATEQADESDPWADAKEEHRKAYQEAMERLEKAEHSAKSNSGRVGALQKKLDELAAQYEAAQKAALEREQAESQKQDDRDISFETDYPDMADYYKRQSEKQIKGVQDGFKGQLETVTNQIRGEFYRSTLDAIKPGWESIASSPEFSSWLTTQDADTQEAAGQLNPGSALKVLTAFEQHTSDVSKKAKQIQQSREQRLKTSATVPSSGKPTRPEETDDFESAFKAAVKRRRQFR